MTTKGSRIEYDSATHMYTIHRPATSELGAVNYRISQLEVMSMADPEGTLKDSDEIFELLQDKRVDSILQPVQRRAAIEHTRKKNGP